MNEFRMGLLRARAAAKWDDLKAQGDHREGRGREARDDRRGKVFRGTRSWSPGRVEIADGMKAVRDEDALMTTIRNEIDEDGHPIRCPTRAGALPSRPWR